jgi:transcriptional regulator with XRE-family HTH domain
MPAATRRDTSAGNSDPASRPAWAQYIITLRARHGLTAREASERMGVTQQTWAGFEAGTRVRQGRRVEVTPKDDTLHRIAKALDLTAPERRHLFALATGTADRNPWQTRLKFARIAAAVTHDQAAAAAGVTVATYREWERKNSGVPRHESLRKLLRHLGWTACQIDEFMATVPPDIAPARPPKQPTNPVRELPQWSQFITKKRVEMGLYLSQVDELLGQQSIVRRFELGGWPRADGRLSVPCCAWLDRIADALSMSDSERANLHLLADNQRVAVASHSNLPLIVELFHEARKAIDISRAEANTRVGLDHGTWSRIETADPSALANLTPALVEHTIKRLPVGMLLAAAMRAAVPTAAEPADISSSAHQLNTSHAFA